MSKSNLITTAMLSQLERAGFAIVPGVVDEALRVELLRGIEESFSPSIAGVRSVTRKLDSIRHLAQSAVICEIVESVLGKDARLVRSILFNKSEAANWQVAWHQDLAIAVQQRVAIEGFGSWSAKDGTPHVQPPVEILEQMLNVRVHLDAADETNGALLVSPGSHLLGRIPANDAAKTARRLGSQLCEVDAGDVLLFRPLTLHTSRKATAARPRRVIHLEFAGVALPAPLEWAEAA
jgi:ectoine hydroxylase-related dioxygenase (phytanoyl-CoA dioxygenase family)